VKKRTYILIGLIWISLGTSAQRFQISDSLINLSRIDTNRHVEFYPSSFHWGDPELGLLFANIDSLHISLNQYLAKYPMQDSAALLEAKRVLVYLSKQISQLESPSPNTFKQDTLVNLNWLNKALHPRFPIPLLDLTSRQIDSLCSFIDSDQRLATEPRLIDTGIRKNTYKKWNFEYLNNHWNAALGIGFFSFLTQPHMYYVDQIERVQSQNIGNGVNMVISADLLYQLDRENAVFLSLPLATLSGASDYKIGLLSTRPALGMGYSRRVGDLMFYLSLLSAPYDKWDDQVLSQIRPKDAVFERIDLSDYPSSKHYHLIGSLGFSIPLY